MEVHEPKNEVFEEVDEQVKSEFESVSTEAEKDPFAKLLREETETIRTVAKDGKARTVQFIKDHKKGLVAGTIVVLGVVACAATKAYTNKQMRAEIAQLTESLANERVAKNHLASRVAELENLCEEKDVYFCEMISDGLRHGSPLAGKHMVDRKQYLGGIG